MEVKIGVFLKEINSSDILCIDTSILIYHLEEIKPYDELTRLLIEKIAEGHFLCNISTLTITELFTKPYRLKDYGKIALFEEFIGSLPNTRIQPIDYEISKFAASLRADYNLRTPDSIILSTAFITKSRHFVTNDTALKKVKLEGLKVLILDEYLEEPS